MEKHKMTFLRNLFGTKDSVKKQSREKTCTVCGQTNSQDVKFCSSCGSEFPVAFDHFDAFISYRRETGSDLASLLKIQLENSYHKRIFLDVKELQVGRFDEALLRRIEETPNFILILSKASLDRCENKSDWLKREIMHAIQTGRNIIPLLIEGFAFLSDDKWALLPPEMKVLSALNGISYSHIHQDSAIRKIASYMKTEVKMPHIEDSSDLEIPQLPKPEEQTPVANDGEKNIPQQTDNSIIDEKAEEIIQPENEPEITISNPIIVTSQINDKHETKETQTKEHSSELPLQILGTLITDSTGIETKLTKFGIVYNSYAKRFLTEAIRDYLIIVQGNATKNIPWNLIDRVNVENPDATIIKRCDGIFMDPMKLQSGTFVGIDEFGFDFALALNDLRSIVVLRGTTDQVCKEKMDLGLSPEPVNPIVGVLSIDSTGTESKLTEFGLVYNPYAKRILGEAIKDFLILDHGSGMKTIPWKLIERVVIQSKDVAEITLCNGKIFEPVKLRNGSLVGTDDLGLSSVLELSNIRSIIPLRKISD